MKFNIFLLILMTVSVFGQETVSLSESDAVMTALARHPSLAAAQAGAEMAFSRVNAARSEGKLQLSANGQATFATMGNVLASPVQPQALLAVQGRASSGVNGMAMLPIYTGGRIQSNIKSGQYNADAAMQDAAVTRVQIAYNVRLRFYEWVQALAMMKIADDALTAQTKNTLVVQQLFDVGKVPRFDLLRARAEQENVRQQVAGSHADVAAARAMLAQSMAVAVNTIPTVPSVKDTLPLPEKSLEIALKKRPDLIASAYKIESAKAALSALNANYHPQVYAIGMIDASVPRNMGKSAGFTIGLIAGLPIMDGGRRKAESSEAEQAIKQAAANREVIMLQIHADVESAEAKLIAAKENIGTAASQVAAVKEAYTVAEARYAAGKSTIVELLDVRRALTGAEQNEVIAQAEYQKILASLYMAMGIDVPEKG